MCVCVYVRVCVCVRVCGCVGVCAGGWAGGTDAQSRVLLSLFHPPALHMYMLEVKNKEKTRAESYSFESFLFCPLTFSLSLSLSLSLLPSLLLPNHSLSFSSLLTFILTEKLVVDDGVAFSPLVC